VADRTIPNPYELAGLAECASPDRPDSPGAEWLTRVANDADDLIEQTDPADLDALHDDTHERADQLVPIYTHHRWEVFTDLAAYQEDVTEYGADASDLTATAGVALYMIAERLITALIAGWAEDEGEEE
jgi:hypothetical protein